MRSRPVCSFLLLGVLLSSTLPAQQPHPAKKQKRNIIIFVADGLRHGSVNASDTPALFGIRQNGVYFKNSHSLFPTFTTANASAIATGHYLGDTGDFSNTIYTGYPLFNTGNFGKPLGSATPFLEDDQRLSDLDDHFNGNYLSESTLLTFARSQGYNTAVVGKLGPVGIQDVEELAPANHDFQTPLAVVVDDSTGKQDSSGHNTGVPLAADIRPAMEAAGKSKAPDRGNGCPKTEQCNNGFTGDNQKPGTTAANTTQQQYFTDVVTQIILPSFIKSGKPFVILVWSRDPDGTQHNQGDSLHALKPGINGPTSIKGVKNADSNLKQILDFLHGNPSVESNTDVFVTSDHGFATVSRHEVNSQLQATQSKSAGHSYVNANGDLEIPKGHLPNGFLVIDLAQALELPLYDPDKPTRDNAGHVSFPKVDFSAERAQRPVGGNGYLGEVQKADGSDAKVIIAANGGADLIYIPDHDKTRARAIVDFLCKQDYVGGVFIDTDIYGELPGALPLRFIGFAGATPLPRPAMVVAFKVFYLQPGDLQSAVQVSDTSLQEGQGMHGGFGRDSTFNNMAAIGPDFKKRYVDALPVSNADIAVTLAHILRFPMPHKGTARGRVLLEALPGGPNTIRSMSKKLVSTENAGGKTILEYQQVGNTLYFDRACFIPAGGKQTDCSQ